MSLFIGDKDPKGVYVGTAAARGVYIGTTLVWPASYTYEILSISIHYSTGSSINAAGSNYAYLTGNVRKSRGGQSEILYDEPLMPIFKTPQSVFSVDQNGHITAGGRGTVDGEALSASVYGRYADVDSTSSVTVTQEANHIVQTVINDVRIQIGNGHDIGITASATSFTLTSYIERDVTWVYTSGDRDNGYDNLGNMTLTAAGTTYTVTNGQSRTFSVSHNKHSISEKTYSASLSYSTYSTSITVHHAADYLVDGEPEIVTPSFISVTQTYNSVSAAGGQLRYSITSGYETAIIQYWNSDGTRYGEKSGTRTFHDDGYTASASGSTAYFHGTKNGNIYTVIHDNMGERGSVSGVTDSITMTFTNTSHSSIIKSMPTISATNYYRDSVSEVFRTFSIQLGTTTFLVGGGNTSLSGKRIYSYKHDWEYTSGTSGSYTETETHTEDVTNRTTFSVSGSGASISGTTLYITSNGHNESMRSFSVSGSWSGYSDTESVSQDKDYLDYVKRQNENYSCSISKDTYYSDIFTANGGRMYIKWVAGHDDATYYKWRSDNADYIVRIPVDDTNTATIEISTQTYPSAQSFKFFRDAYGQENKHIVTHENMSDNSRLSGRETTATERCTVRVTNNGVTNSVELDAVTNTYSGRIYETPTASLSVSEIYYTGASVPVMVGISQWSFARYSAGDYDRKQEGGSVLVSSFSGTAYSDGSKDGNSYVKALALPAARDRTRVYRISSATYTDLGGTSRTMSASYDVYQESLAVTATNLYEITKFTISGVTSKEIAWDYQSNLPIVTEGRMRIDTHYNAGGGRLEWDVTGTWDTPSGRAMGISATGATGFTIPSSTSTSGTASIGCSQNTGTSDRNMTVTASWGGQTATCTVSQAHRVSITLTLSANPSLRRATVSASAAVKSNVNIEASVTWILTTSPLTTQTKSYTVSIANGATSGYTTESSLRPVGYQAVHILTITPGVGDTTNYINGTP